MQCLYKCLLIIGNKSRRLWWIKIYFRIRSTGDIEYKHDFSYDVCIDCIFVFPCFQSQTTMIPRKTKFVLRVTLTVKAAHKKGINVVMKTHLPLSLILRKSGAGYYPRCCLEIGLGTNIAKNVLHFFLEILIKFLNFLKNLLHFSEI